MIEGAVSKGISSVAQLLDARMEDGTKVDGALSGEHIKGDRSANLPPGLGLCKDNRRLGVGPTIEQPPETQRTKRWNLTLTR